MLYRDFMQKYRPLYAPDDGTGAASTDGAAAAAASPPADGGAAVPAATTEAAAAPATSEAPSSDAAPAADAGEPTLLEGAIGKKPEAKAEGDKESPAPADAAKPEGEAKPEDGKDKPETKAEDKTADGDKDAAKADPENKDAPAEDQPPAPVKYEAFKVPEGVALGEKELEKFTEFAGKAQIPQDIAQGLVDMYVEERKQDAARAAQHQQDVWKGLNNTWKDDLRNDPELGGNRLETTLSRAKAVVEEYLGNPQYGGSPELVQSLMSHVKANGMGNFKPFVRLLNTIGEQLNIFEDSPVTTNLQPPKATRGPGNRGWYPNSNMGNGAKAP